MSTERAINAVVREERAARRAQDTGPCELCGSTVDVARTERGVRCYGHRFSDRARSECHHPAGLANLPGWTIKIIGNYHRQVSELWVDLGFADLPPAAGDPVLLTAYTLAGLATIAILVTRWLAELATFLRDQHGATWWAGAPPFPLG